MAKTKSYRDVCEGGESRRNCVIPIVENSWHISSLPSTLLHDGSLKFFILFIFSCKFASLLCARGAIWEEGSRHESDFTRNALKLSALLAQIHVKYSHHEIYFCVNDLFFGWDLWLIYEHKAFSSLACNTKPKSRLLSKLFLMWFPKRRREFFISWGFRGFVRREKKSSRVNNVRAPVAWPSVSANLFAGNQCCVSSGRPLNAIMFYCRHFECFARKAL